MSEPVLDERTARLAGMRLAVEGLSVADALGEQLFARSELREQLIAWRAVPSGPWRWSDDTLMALSLVEVLRGHGQVAQNALARSFAHRYDPTRGYSAGTHALLGRLRAGEAWRAVAAQMFDGEGSRGNGAAMRVAPVGAYFAGDLARVRRAAEQQAAVSHAHAEGAAGAVAVAVMAALACVWRGRPLPVDRGELLAAVLEWVPEGTVAAGIRQAQTLGRDLPVSRAAAVLGNGSEGTAANTVPFALWCAAWHLDNYENAVWSALAGLGDMDTTAAIAGGIVALHTGLEQIPEDWRAAREPLPEWPFAEEDEKATVTLFRPVGRQELALIEQSGFRAFPPRLPGQPIFYPVLTEAYAAQIAREWNTRDPWSGNAGFVTRFQVRASFLHDYTVPSVGSQAHQEYWIPAEHLEAFNAQLVGKIEVIGEYLVD